MTKTNKFVVVNIEVTPSSSKVVGSAVFIPQPDFSKIKHLLSKKPLRFYRPTQPAQKRLKK